MGKENKMFVIRPPCPKSKKYSWGGGMFIIERLWIIECLK